MGPDVARDIGFNIVSQMDDIKNLFKRISDLKETKTKLHKETCSNIKATSEALISRIKLREETLLGETTKRHRNDLANLTRAEFNLKKRIDDMTRLRKSVTATQLLLEESPNNASYLSQMGLEIDSEIEKLLEDGEVILSYYSFTVHFQEVEQEQLLFGSLQERPIPRRQLSTTDSSAIEEKSRRHTVTEAPDMSKLRPGSPIARKETKENKTRRFTVLEPPDPRQLHLAISVTIPTAELNMTGPNEQTKDAPPIPNGTDTSELSSASSEESVPEISQPLPAPADGLKNHLSPRRFTVTEKPKRTLSNLRKARSTNDIAFTSSRMTLAFTMSNDDLSNIDSNQAAEPEAAKTSDSVPLLSPRLVFLVSKTGTGPGELKDPRDVTVLPNGDICVAEYGNQRLQLFSPDGKSKLLMNQVPFRPNGVAMTRDGYIAVTDDLEKHIKAFTRSGALVCKFGTGYFKNLTSIKTTSKDLYVLIESGGGRHPYVCIYDSMTGLRKRIGQAENGDYLLSNPSYVTSNSNDDIYVSDGGLHCVWQFDSTGKLLRKIGGKGEGEGQFHYPMGTSVDGEGNLYVADCGKHRVCQFNERGEFVKTVLDRTHGLKYPKVVHVSKSRLIVVQTAALLVFQI